MDLTEVEISSVRLFVIFLHAFALVLQVIGVYVLYHTNNLRATQKIILMNVSFCHIVHSVFAIYTFSKPIENSEVPNKGLWLSYVLGFHYTLLMHCLFIGRMLEIYLHLKYPIYMTKKVSYFIIMLLWLMSWFLAFAVSLIIRCCSNLKDKLFRYIVSIMIWCVVCTALFVYSYIYRKWTSLHRNIPRIKQSARRNSNAFLVPFLVVFTFAFFQGSGSVLMMIQNTIELSGSSKSLLECVMSMLFAFGVISDALIYIFLQKVIRKKFLLKIRYCLVEISCRLKCWSS